LRKILPKFKEVKIHVFKYELVGMLFELVGKISNHYETHGKKLTIIKTFGSISTLLEAATILYLFASSLFGFYTLPKLSRLKPSKFNTSLQKMIVNCTLLLSLSSCLPLLAITLNFVDAKDVLNQNQNSASLLSEYDLDNDENVYLVLVLNFIYIGSTVMSLVRYLNVAVLERIKERFRGLEE